MDSPDSPADRRLPAAAPSKTDLRRGQFTPGSPFPKKAPAPRRGVATTNDEQALLFDENAKAFGHENGCPK